MKRESVMIKVGLMGYGKAGQAVAEVFHADPSYQLCWITRRTTASAGEVHAATGVPVMGLDTTSMGSLLDAHPVDAIVDFSNSEALLSYGEEVRQRQLMLVSAISSYTPEQLQYAHTLGQSTRVLCSPNMTVGINFLILAAKLLRTIAPFADVEILEQHFRGKPEVSGTARKIADTLEVDADRITSLRLGGIIGHHEVIFGFPYQTVRLIHNSIERKAFGTGAVFALGELLKCENGFYTFDDLLMKLVRSQLALD